MNRQRNPFPHVSRVTDRHGRVRWRFRCGLVDCYLPGAYGSAEFRAAYETALSGSRPDGAPTVRQARYGTVDWLVQRFYQSPAWAGLADTSRAERRAFWERMRAEHGTKPVAGLQTKHIAAMAAKKAATPHAANRIIKRWRQLLTFAVRQGLIATNPALAAEVYKTPDGGFHTWTEAEVQRFEAKHPAGSQARLALRLMLYTGAARADVVRLGWGNVRDGRIRFTRRKSGGEVDLRILPELAEELARLPHRVGLFLMTEEARPKAFTAEGFGNKVRGWCDAAELPDCSAHGLRKAGATALAYAGASEAEIAAFLGHKGTQEAATYVRAAQRGRLADGAFEKLEAAKGKGVVSNLRPQVGQKGD
jgi:integrase